MTTCTDPSRRFTVPLDVTIRPCVRDDLPALEWFGLYTAHRELIHAAFERQERDEVLMLVAEANGFPVGQAWIDLTKRGAESVGVLWAVRVFPALQRLGIGARLIAASEEALRARGFACAELGVERGAESRAFYERLGYRVTGTLLEHYHYTTPEGGFRRVAVDQWVLRKELGPGAEI